MIWRTILIVCSCFVCAYADQESNTETIIRAKAKQYQEAYNKADVKALSRLWADDASYVFPDNGTTIQGRAELEKQFADDFKDSPGEQLELTISKIKFPTSDKAIEIGKATVRKNGEIQNETLYKATYEKRGNDWLLTHVREVETQDAPSQYEHLKDLEWIVGKWDDADEDANIEFDNDWDKYKNFLTQKFTVSNEDTVQIEGKQIIAWDPVNEKIRSWIFDSDGGFGEGIWKKKANKWVVETVHTLADGRKASSINIYTPIDKNSYTWQSVGREVGGEMLPNIGPVTVVRKKG